MKRLVQFSTMVILLTLSFPNFTLSQTLKIIHFNVGDGDATLILSPSGETLLVDSGKDRSSVVTAIATYLEDSLEIYDLDYTLATHYHDDHIGGFIDLFNLYGYLPDTAFDRGSNPGYHSQTYADYINAAGAARTTITPNYVIDLGLGVAVWVVCVNGTLYNGTYPTNLPVTGGVYENVRSICLLLEYNNFRYVVAGDLIGQWVGGLNYDMETPCSQAIGEINTFQVNHHGGGSSTNRNWLTNLSPETAVVSGGSLQGSQSVMNRLEGMARFDTLYHTGTMASYCATKSVVCNDNIVLETDGLTYYDISWLAFTDTYAIGADAASGDVSLCPTTSGSPYRINESVKSYTPTELALFSAFPNPFNATTVISFELRVASLVKLEVFDVRGNIVGARPVSPLSGSGATPTTDFYTAGSHRITFNGTGLPSGIYIYCLTAGNFTGAGKMVLIK
ncbi:hypothetical protein CEE37_13295 [candidate division LCP-89 bacterium B3_LCP]|uniref:Metallo-beta-lactamase domain-containing protein n=1 Tax=candidate division LCP-89 bacterium B3_LCP TaxID=2012998 RepID=A0A532USL4_UNCL8|nr:MAG: hypothetical protein CEE37_13295 [candidate division LCP-89 bacterium B3_LCP]